MYNCLELDNLKCQQSFEHVKHISLPTSGIGGISYLAAHHHARTITAPTDTTLPSLAELTTENSSLSKEQETKIL